MRLIRSTSSLVLSRTRRASEVSLSARRLTSSSERIAASGLRSSCETSATIRCCSSTPRWMRASIVFSVAASRATSSPVAGTARRSSSLSPPISCACARRRSIGLSARPASHQPPAAVAISAAGPAISRRTSTRWTEPSTPAIDTPAATTTGSPRREAARATRRKRSSFGPSWTVRVIRRPASTSRWSAALSIGERPTGSP